MGSWLAIADPQTPRCLEAQFLITNFEGSPLIYRFFVVVVFYFFDIFFLLLLLFHHCAARKVGKQKVVSDFGFFSTYCCGSIACQADQAPMRLTTPFGPPSGRKERVCTRANCFFKVKVAIIEA